MGQLEENIFKTHSSVKIGQRIIWNGAGFALRGIKCHQMNNEKTLPEDVEKNEKEDMPVKTPATDSIKNTANEPGLNAARSINNDLEPGTESIKPAFIKKD